jgi:hypothetical protein
VRSIERRASKQDNLVAALFELFRKQSHGVLAAAGLRKQCSVKDDRWFH